MFPDLLYLVTVIASSHLYSGKISGGFSVVVNRNSPGGLCWMLEIKVGFDKMHFRQCRGKKSQLYPMSMLSSLNSRTHFVSVNITTVSPVITGT